MLAAAAQAVGLEFNITLPLKRPSHVPQLSSGMPKILQHSKPPGQRNLGDLFASVFTDAFTLLQRFDPAKVIVVVQGDTTTSLAAALAAAYQRVPVAHVEAGLRTYDSNNPFPEEINRRLIDHVSTFLFPPTTYAEAALLREGIDAALITTVGNTVVDSLIGMVPGPVPDVVDKYMAFTRKMDASAVKVSTGVQPSSVVIAVVVVAVVEHRPTCATTPRPGLKSGTCAARTSTAPHDELTPACRSGISHLGFMLQPRHACISHQPGSCIDF
jgi:hypothetical protein